MGGGGDFGWMANDNILFEFNVIFVLIVIFAEAFPHIFQY